MIDISAKSNSLRYAKAQGILFADRETVDRVREKKVPKGDVLAVARSAGIQAGKRCSDWMVFCHPIPMDWLDLHFEMGEDQIQVTAEARTYWKTGVEMEAIVAVSGALLNMYDMLKPLCENLVIGHIKVTEKKGGKSDL